jgi:hypothetical protein
MEPVRSFEDPSAYGPWPEYGRVAPWGQPLPLTDALEPEPTAQLDWKPGGIFPAGEEPAAAGETPLPAPGAAVRDVFQARVPLAETRTGARLIDVTPVIAWTEVPCLGPAQEKQPPRRVPRVLGWLYRWARGFDIEKGNATPPLLYLRSPLLSGFQEPVGCPPDDTAAQDRRATRCFAVTASNGFDHVLTYLVPLPQLGARTAPELRAVLRQRLDEGEKVAMRTIGGAVVELRPEEAAALDVRACETRTD